MKISYLQSRDVWELMTGEVSLNTQKDVDDWEKELVALLKSMGRRAYVLVDTTGMQISPAVADAYGAVVKKVVPTYTLGLVRYRKGDDLTGAAIRLEAVINRYPSNIYADRAAALAALTRIRQTFGVPSDG